MTLIDIHVEGWVCGGTGSRWSSLVLRLLGELAIVKVLLGLEVCGGEVRIGRRSCAHQSFPLIIQAKCFDT